MQTKGESKNQFNLCELWCQKILFYIDQFGKQLPISDSCVKKSKNMVNKLRDYSVRFSGKDLRAIAGALLYINAIKNHEQLIFNKICKVAKISQPIIKNRIKDIHEILSLASKTH